MKRLVLFVSLGLAVVTSAAENNIVTSESADPQEMLSQYIAAINAGDVSAALELFADDAVITIDEQGEALRCPPPGACFDTTAIQPFLQQQVSEGQQLTVIRTETSGDGIVAGSLISLVSGRTTTAGVNRVIVNVLIAERDGTIAKLTVRPDLSDPDTAAFFAGKGGSPMQPPKAGDAGLAAGR